MIRSVTFVLAALVCAGTALPAAAQAQKQPFTIERSW